MASDSEPEIFLAQPPNPPWNRHSNPLWPTWKIFEKTPKK